MKAQNAQNILTVNDLTIGYGSNSIAEKINFSLSAGELTAIIGVNGIGKSTLLRTLGNVQPSVSGSIQIGQEHVENLSPLALAEKISLVLTEPIASKNMSVIELIALGRQPYTNWIGSLSAEDKVIIKQAVTLLSLQDLQDRKCFELSDGQLQRVMIARALAQDTDIVLLDEPTTHLDLNHKVQILKLLRYIAHQTGKTILFTSHEINMALQLCDTLLLLDGKQNPFGKPDDLIKSKALKTLFPEDILSFDNVSRSFKIKN